MIPTQFVGGGGRQRAAREASEVTSTELLPPPSFLPHSSPAPSSPQPLLPSARLLLCFSQGLFVSRSTGTRVGVATLSRPALTCLFNSDYYFFQPSWRLFCAGRLCVCAVSGNIIKFDERPFGLQSEVPLFSLLNNGEFIQDTSFPTRVSIHGVIIKQHQ